MLGETVRTKSRQATLYLPEELLDAADNAVQTGRYRSRNELVAAGLRHMIKQLNREAIDAAIAAAADDEEYLAEQAQIMAEFETADAEAFRLAETEW